MATLPRVALIFDHEPRPETTAIYCQRALAGLAETHVFHPREVGRIAPGSFDLYLNIDDGMRYTLPPHLRPCAYWAIDTHMDYGWSLEKSRGFDFVFAAQRDGARRLLADGIDTAKWLPLACDPQIHGLVGAGGPSPQPSSATGEGESERKRYDVCFVGNVFPGARADLLRLIRREFPNSFVGNAYFEDMARMYVAA